MTEYIRGIRQFKAIIYFWECLWHGFFEGYIPIQCAKRELEIFFGFAKPYKIRFMPSFWESLRNIGIEKRDIDELKGKYE